MVCDLAANAMRFYVNDQILCVTAESYPVSASYLSELVDKTIAVGDPFVWKLDPAEVKLSECYPYLSVFQPGIRAEFIDWMPPPEDTSA